MTEDITFVGDTISRQAAINAADRADYPGLAVELVKAVTDEVIKELKKLTSEDAIEVVRCKDCKYFDSGTDEDGKLFFKCLGWVYGGTSEDDFCSHGERRDE